MKTKQEKLRKKVEKRNQLIQKMGDDAIKLTLYYPNKKDFIKATKKILIISTIIIFGVAALIKLLSNLVFPFYIGCGLFIIIGFGGFYALNKAAQIMEDIYDKTKKNNKLKIYNYVSR
jgi:hypothetical protein